jgi:hypothetical protein
VGDEFVFRLPKNWPIYAALLAGLLILVDIGVTTATAILSAADAHPANRDNHFDRDFDLDYVQGLAKRGIVKLPGYEPPPVAPIAN